MLYINLISDDVTRAWAIGSDLVYNVNRYGG